VLRLQMQRGSRANLKDPGRQEGSVRASGNAELGEANALVRARWQMKQSNDFGLQKSKDEGGK